MFFFSISPTVDLSNGGADDTCCCLDIVEGHWHHGGLTPKCKCLLDAAANSLVLVLAVSNDFYVSLCNTQLLDFVGRSGLGGNTPNNASPDAVPPCHKSFSSPLALALAFLPCHNTTGHCAICASIFLPQHFLRNCSSLANVLRLVKEAKRSFVIF